MLTPRIESVIAEKQGKIVLAKVDIDEHTDLALDYEVNITITPFCLLLQYVYIHCETCVTIEFIF